MAPKTMPLVPQNQSPTLIDIFNNSQHVASSDLALNQLKKFYKKTEFNKFEPAFRNCVKKLIQSKHTIYFRTSCDFLCKFLKHLSNLSDEIKTKGDTDATTTLENADPKFKRPTRAASKKPQQQQQRPRRAVAKPRRGTKRKACSNQDDEDSDDELLGGLMSSSRVANSTIASEQNEQKSESDDDSALDETTVILRRKSGASVQNRNTSMSAIITNHDRVISSCVDVADLYMQVVDEECRHNAVYFISKLVSEIDSLDEEICSALRSTLPKRIRDRKAIIRAQAVYASRTFQDSKMIQEGFLHHFYRDPELVVRRALISIMDTKIFGCEFLIDSTQDTHDVLRKVAFQRLGKMNPNELNKEQIHRVLHNGLIERDRIVSYAFKANTLEPWLSALYDGLDLYQLVEKLDVLNHHSDIKMLLCLIHEKDLDKIQNNGSTTQLHRVIENFRAKWLATPSKQTISCLPQVDKIDEKLVTSWLSLIKFTKDRQANIKNVKVRESSTQPTSRSQGNESIEKILDSIEVREETVELYERITPDLVNLLDFLKRFIQRSDQLLKNKLDDLPKLEFIYHELMDFILTYEIGDEVERKTVQEVLGMILKENLLTGKFKSFIPPIIKTLFNLVYSSSSNLMINYISELINNVRSHLEDLVSNNLANVATDAFCQPARMANIKHSAIKAPSDKQSRVAARPIKKVRIDSQPFSGAIESEASNLEYQIANIRVDLEVLKDKLDFCIKEKDFDSAKAISNQIDDLKSKMALMRDRRCSLALDISHMSMLDTDGPGMNDKLSSTMLATGQHGRQSMALLNDSSSSLMSTDTVKKDNPSTNLNGQDPKIFRHHSNELIKCLQMYYGCLQNVTISQVPPTMLNHLSHLSLESLDDYFKDNIKIRSLMVACNALTAIIDREFAHEPTTMTLLIAACLDPYSIEVRTVGFKGLVDVVCQHINLILPADRVEKFLRSNLRDYGRYDQKTISESEFEFATALIEGASKLLYHRRLSSPEVFSHLIIWWYHPRTPSRLKQYIGLFLPMFVNDLSIKAARHNEASAVTANKTVVNDENRPVDEDDNLHQWLRGVLENAYVVSIEYLHDYILGAGFNIMSASDMMSLINFLSSLMPVSFHAGIREKLEDRIADLSENSHDLVDYLKQAKKELKVLE